MELEFLTKVAQFIDLSLQEMRNSAIKKAGDAQLHKKKVAELLSQLKKAEEQLKIKEAQIQDLVTENTNLKKGSSILPTVSDTPSVSPKTAENASGRKWKFSIVKDTSGQTQEIVATELQ